MNILLFGATGMVGDGVLRWLIASPKVSRVVAVSRKPLAVKHLKPETIIEPDMFHLQHLIELRDFDACLCCPNIKPATPAAGEVPTAISPPLTTPPVVQG